MENPSNAKPEDTKQDNEKLLVLKTGYSQHPQPFLLTR
jgi:hypothetical protein